MKKNKFLVSFIMVLGLAGLVVLNGCKTNDEVELKNIVETAIESGNFNTLVTALQATDLVDTLNGPGPFTVFAPTDEAFGKLPAGTIDALLNDIPALTNILLYHVSSGNYLASVVTQLSTISMVNGSISSISIQNGNAMIDNAMIVQTDIVCSNGVIHVIDAVIIPQG